MCHGQDGLGDSKVAVLPSKIEGAGKGAFALQSFKKGELVGIYRCEVRKADRAHQARTLWIDSTAQSVSAP